MAFGALGDRLQDIFSRIRKKGRLTENDVAEAMREIRVALLEADVNYKVAKDFINRVKERAVGSDVLQSLTPGQQVVKIVHEEMTALMGQEQAKLNTSSKPPNVILMVGLQGSGKTTSSGKIALWLRSQGKRPLLAAADVYRPAAIRQLEVLGEKTNIPVFSLGDKVSPVEIAKQALEQALTNGNDYLIIDTAGRLQINEELMLELENIRQAVNPGEILLVIDAMAGQDAVNVAATFNQRLEVSGIVLTKLDGDTRGGAALSVKAVTGKPIKFTGSGEKLEALDPFYPDRMASRILGMGDVLTLIEKAQNAADQAKIEEMEEKLRQARFTFDDFLEQMQQIKKMGSLEEILSMVPGVGKQLKDIQIDEKQMGKVEAIIKSMTPQERENPALINGSRKLRIAKGSGNQVQDVNRLLKQFEQMQKMIKQMGDDNPLLKARRKQKDKKKKKKKKR
ncbi:MAG: signal recognition particle protein [Clostridiales bacterium]|jgi:signal recognition particle subunit SRP54|nr:signal recognition particle protein [Clostridiales bacterium]